MTPEELRHCGEKLYGNQWQSKLADALEVDPRSVRYWLSGKHKINKRTADAIRTLIGKLE
jgi:hypothetical protein